MKYPLASNPIFWTIQGEAHLRGFQMCFVRLAGCSVGCEHCDTDYQRAGSSRLMTRSLRAPMKSRRRTRAIAGFGSPAASQRITT